MATLLIPADTSQAALGYLLEDGTIVGSTSQTQDFGSTGIKTDVLVESTSGAGILIDGTTDAVQLTVQGHSTQTNDLLRVEQSDGTAQFLVQTGDPHIQILGNVSFSTAGATLQNSSGNARIAIDATIGMGDSAEAQNTAILDVNLARTAATFSLLNLRFSPTAVSAGQTYKGINLGGTITTDGKDITIFRGLDFVPTLSGSGTTTEYTLLRLGPQMTLSPVITTFRGLWIDRPAGFLYVIGASSGTSIGIDIEDVGHANFDNIYGLRIAALTAGGTLTKPILQEGTVGTNEFNAATVFNEAGADVDFRVEGVGAANALFVQGSDGNVGIGTSTPQKNLHIESAVPTIRLSDSNAATDQAVATLIEFYRGNLTNRVGFWGMESSSNDVMKLATDYAAGEIVFSTGSSVEAVRIDASQNVGISGALTAVSYGGILEANLLDKTAAEIISGAWEFTAASTRLSSTQPILDFNETDGPVDEKFWRWTASIGDLYLQTKTDALGVGANVLRITRTGTTVDLIRAVATTVDVVGALTATSYGGITEANLLDKAATETVSGVYTFNTLHVDQASTTAAIPVLTLDQADISEEMIEFVSTIGTGNAIEAAVAKTLTTTHFIKVTLPGSLTRYIPAGTIA